MTLRFLQSRGVRKFRRNRLAMVAFGVIGLYVLAAVVILVFGVVTVEDTMERVGPSQMPGLGASPGPEERLAFAGAWLDPIDGALRRADPAQALGEVRFAEVRAAARTVDEMRDEVARADELYRRIAAFERLGEHPEVLPLLDELEGVVGSLYQRPTGLEGLAYSLRTSLGTDRQGRSIAVRAFYSIKVAAQIGMITALISVLIGSVLGAAAAYFGGWIDGVVTWLYSTLSSIPYLVLLVLVAYVFSGGTLDGTLVPVYAAFCLTFWIGPCRVVRGETLKLKELEYVQAATAVGFGRLRILLRHVLPNTAHLMFINFSLLFIGAVKSEVILSFLGLGVKEGSSWGIMISQSRQEVINGFFWQIGAATAFMFGLVLAFNVLTDALQDAFDPKHVS